MIFNIQLLLLFVSCGDTKNAATDSNWDYVKVPPGADPSVSAKDGGAGFEKISESLGYKTQLFSEEELKFFGDKRALKGGTLKDYASRFPATMRLFGKEANYLENYWIELMCYETLLERHPVTYEPNIPRIASHWKISDDKTQFWFRIDPNARWADGRRITSEDVVATWHLLMDESILDPSQQVAYGKFEEPIAILKKSSFPLSYAHSINAICPL